MVPTFLVTVEKLLDAPPSHCISLPQLSQLIGTISSQTQALSFSTKIPHLHQLATLDWGHKSKNPPQKQSPDINTTEQFQ